MAQYVNFNQLAADPQSSDACLCELYSDVFLQQSVQTFFIVILSYLDLYQFCGVFSFVYKVKPAIALRPQVASDLSLSYQHLSLSLLTTLSPFVYTE